MKAATVDLSDPRFWLRFSDGLIVDRTRCPLRLQAHAHWRREPQADQPNAVCTCPADPTRGD